MVYVRLARPWTDGTGAGHAAGDMVDVDAVTLAELEATGVVASEGAGTMETAAWAGPTGGSTDGGSTDWAGPTSDPV